MTLRTSKLVAFDGTHASGKTTLIYAVAARLRRHGIHVGILGEPARTSPFVDDVVLHKSGDFDMLLELDIFAAQITNCVRAARSYDVVLADKTPTNVLAYCKMVLSIELDTWDSDMVDAMDMFCQKWGQAYDAIFFCQDHYGVTQKGDRYREKVAHLQQDADDLVQLEYERLGQPLIYIPRAMDIDERATWVMTELINRKIIEIGVDA